MRSFRPLTLAIACAIAAVPCLAMAQDTTSASGKHFTLVGGIAQNQPTGDATVNGERADFDGEPAATLSAAYDINDNISIEAWGADKASHRVSTSAGKVASVDAQPYALSGQYHFRTADSTVRPFVGLGYFESNISNETPQAGAALDGQRLGMSTAKGPMATVGVDVNFSPTWFARADARYLKGDSDVEIDGSKAGTADMDPVVVGIGVGAHF